MTLVLGTKMPWNEMTSISMGYYRAASWRSIRLIPANISVISGATKEQGSLFIAPLANRKLSRLNEGCKQNIKASVINHHDSYLFFQFLRIMLNKVLPVIYKVARVLKYVPSSHTYKQFFLFHNKDKGYKFMSRLGVVLYANKFSSIQCNTSRNAILGESGAHVRHVRTGDFEPKKKAPKSCMSSLQIRQLANGKE